jgi:subtilase family serine protease
MRQVFLQLEELESRAMLSANSVTAAPTATAAESNGTVHPLLMIVPQTISPQLSPAPSGFTPKQIEQAYGVSPLLASGTTGKGETIAIVDGYYDPHLLSDVQTFNTQFGLQQFNVTGGPTLKQIASGGGAASSLRQDPTGDWPLETSLDVEWAHAIAPQANIVLVEGADGSDPAIFSATQYAATKVPGVVAVSMSWGDYEFSGETGYDYIFMPKSSTNPNGANPGITFVAASGDTGALTIYPAVSPYVLGVGGTSLYTTTNSLGATVYSSESAWDGSGGGPSSFEGYPSYQYNQPWIKQNYGYPYNVQVYNYATGTYSNFSARMSPDVAYNADPSTGFPVYDSTPSSDYAFSGGWDEVGGTSAGAPQWSGIIALADQQRAAKLEKPLDTNQVLNALYNTLGSSATNPTYTSVFHDITTGTNGYDAVLGYDLATGLGSPIVNKLVPFLANPANTKTPLGQLPTITGSGYGSTGLGGFTTFTTFSRTAGSVRSGGGLYTDTGSLSILPGSEGVNGPNTHTGGVPIASAPAAPSSISVIVLASPMSAANATLDAVATSTPLNATSFLGSDSALTPGLPSASLASNTMLTSSTNALVTQATLVFGASGWNGSPLSWRLSSLGLSGQGIGESAADLSGDSEEDSSDSSSEDAISTNGDAGGVGLRILEGAPEALFDGQVSDGGDGNAGSQ